MYVVHLLDFVQFGIKIYSIWANNNNKIVAFDLVMIIFRSVFARTGHSNLDIQWIIFNLINCHSFAFVKQWARISDLFAVHLSYRLILFFSLFNQSGSTVCAHTCAIINTHTHRSWCLYVSCCPLISFHLHNFNNWTCGARNYTHIGRLSCQLVYPKLNISKTQCFTFFAITVRIKCAYSWI